MKRTKKTSDTNTSSSSRKRSKAWRIVHPNAAGIDVGPSSHDVASLNTPLGRIASTENEESGFSLAGRFVVDDFGLKMERHVLIRVRIGCRRSGIQLKTGLLIRWACFKPLKKVEQDDSQTLFNAAIIRRTRAWYGTSLCHKSSARSTNYEQAKTANSFSESARPPREH